MDYVVGSVAALISGNVTPNRPRLIRRALTPTKHQLSPNVTPKSELVEDRSIFLSPTLQKKKAIVKKSPKRIFQNPDLDATGSNEADASAISPKAEKVKKHLRDELEADSITKTSGINLGSPKIKHNTSTDSVSPKKAKLIEANDNLQKNNESTPKKNKKKGPATSLIRTQVPNIDSKVCNEELSDVNSKSPKKTKQRRKSLVDDTYVKDIDENAPNHEITESDVENDAHKGNQTKKGENRILNEDNENQLNSSKTKNKKLKKKSKTSVSNDNINVEDNNIELVNKTEENDQNLELQNDIPKKKNKKLQKKSKQIKTDDEISEKQNEKLKTNTTNKHKKKPLINPNAITQEDSASEHESDNEIESENEEINKKMLETDPVDETSEEEEEKEEKVENKLEKKVEKVRENSEEEVKRTIFVGNVPFSKKCKKEIKRIFSKYGQIETIRIRTVPVKEAHVTPKLAVIKNELHPERSTVNVYVKFSDPDSVEEALMENNTTLNHHHLRVTRSATTGAEHDPRSSIFVGNLPFALEDEAFREKFEKCGDIESVRIIRDKKTNAGKGFGYINFKSKDGVELALALTEEDLTIKNRILRVKRCTQTTHKQGQGRSQGNQRRNFGGQNFDNKVRQQGRNFGGQNFDSQVRQQGRNFGGQNRNNQGRSQGRNFREQNENKMGRNFGGQNRNNPERNHGRNFGGQNGNSAGRNFGGQNRNNPERSQGRFQGNTFGGKNDNNENHGAFRRIMNKRKPEESNHDGPPNKKQKDITQPREKKPKKEFVGMTAEKKKKHKFDKGQKKKKALSEILTK